MDNTINILVVDDESSVRDFFERLLQLKGFGTSSAGSGPEALELIDQDNIHVMIIDIFMPGMDGFQLLDKVKEKYPKIATIMMTGMNDSQMIRKATLHGADEYITKPFKREELSLVIERAIWKIMSIEPIIK